MSNAVWRGLPLRDLLMSAGPRPGVAKVVLYGADGYTDTYPLEKALEPTTFVAYEMNGEPLRGTSRLPGAHPDSRNVRRKKRQVGHPHRAGGP